MNCDYCGLPAVCYGADLVDPRYRCPRCCREYSQFGGVHGPAEYLAGHAAAEGLAL
jgi:transposase-like protein